MAWADSYADGSHLGWVQGDGQECQFDTGASVYCPALYLRAAASNGTVCVIGQGSDSSDVIVVTNHGDKTHDLYYGIRYDSNPPLYRCQRCYRLLPASEADGPCWILRLSGPAVGVQPCAILADDDGTFLLFFVNSATTYKQVRVSPTLDVLSGASGPIPLQITGTSQGILNVDPDGTIHWTDLERVKVVAGLPFGLPMTRGLWTIGQNYDGYNVLAYDALTNTVYQVSPNAANPMPPRIAVNNDGHAFAALSSIPAQLVPSSAFTVFQEPIPEPEPPNPEPEPEPEPPHPQPEPEPPMPTPSFSLITKFPVWEDATETGTTDARPQDEGGGQFSIRNPADEYFSVNSFGDSVWKHRDGAGADELFTANPAGNQAIARRGSVRKVYGLL